VPQQIVHPHLFPIVGGIRAGARYPEYLHPLCSFRISVRFMIGR
jgi:hypothetical protein